jgi:hypothetical protein
MAKVDDMRRDEEVARLDLIGVVMACIALGEELKDRGLAGVGEVFAVF